MKRAVIVGAGIAGLTAALRLGQDGWQVLVIERAPVRRTGGYMLNVLGSGFDSAERLGITPKLSGRALGAFATVLVRADGSPKTSMSLSFAKAAMGSRTLAVFRSDLESVLYQEVQEKAEFRFGTTVVSVEQDSDRVRVQLSDGSTAEADLLVGADGVHSATRAAVFGQEYRVDMPYMVAACRLDDPPGEVPDRTAVTYIGPGRTAGVVNLGPQRNSAFFTYKCADPVQELAQGPVDSLRNAFGDLAGAFPEVFRQLEKDPSEVYFDRVSQVVMPRWSAGRVVMLGDAAWSVTLFAGYGAALAMSGADRLGEFLQQHPDDVPKALQEWEEQLRPDVLKRQALAHRGIYFYAPPSRFHVWMNDVTMRVISAPGVRNLVQRAIRRQNR